MYRFSLFYFVSEGNFQVQATLGGLYLEGRFNRRFFALRVWGDFYLEGLIFGILRYCSHNVYNIFLVYVILNSYINI